MFDWVLNAPVDTKVKTNLLTRTDFKVLQLHNFRKPSILLQCNNDKIQEKITN